MRFSLYVGSAEKSRENTRLNTTNIENGLTSAQTKPPTEPW